LKWLKQKNKIPYDDKCGDWFSKTHKILNDSNYTGYELYNFSNNNMECKHTYIFGGLILIFHLVLLLLGLMKLMEKCEIFE
jgi:hypothetical protein